MNMKVTFDEQKRPTGTQYIGESNRNLKTRLAEHQARNSVNSLSVHLRQNSHSPEFKNTLILAQERNTVKRKLIESFAIDSKAARMCNAGLSIELPAIWKTCTPFIQKELACTD